MQRIVIVFIFIFVGMVGQVEAESTKIYETQQLGKGGSYVTDTTQGVGGNWNPAGLGVAQESDEVGFGFMLPLAFETQVTGNFLTVADELQTLVTRFDSIQANQTAGGPLDTDAIAAFLTGLNKMNELNQPGTGLLFNFQAGLGFRMGQLAFWTNNFGTLGVAVLPDLVNIGLGPSLAAGVVGVDFTGANPSGALFNADQTQAALDIQQAINNLGFTPLDDLTGNAIIASGLANSTDLANALVNFSITNGATDADILSAASEALGQSAGLGPIIAAAASGNAYTENETSILVNGVLFSEVGVGYGFQLPFYEDLRIGVTARLVRGEVGFMSIDLLNSTQNFSISETAEITKVTTQPSFDIGAIWKVPYIPFETHLGVVLKNINSPEFKQPLQAQLRGFQNVTLKPQTRVGLAIKPIARWVISADMDLTDNETILRGFDSQDLSIGTEFRLFNSNMFDLPIRVGFIQNINSHVDTYTAGLGLYFAGFRLDLAGAISDETEQITINDKTRNIPKRISASLQLSFFF